MSDQDLRTIIVMVDMNDPLGPPDIDIGNLPAVVAAAVLQQAASDLDGLVPASRIRHSSGALLEPNTDEETS